MDIKPAPRRPKPPVVPRIDSLRRPPAPVAPVPPKPAIKQPAPDELPIAVGMPTKKPKRKMPLWAWIVTVLLTLLVAASVAAGLWYNWATGAPSSSGDKVRVVVEKGQTATDISNTLYDHELIRSRLAFNLYTQLSGTRDDLQAGGYVLSPDQSVSSIVEHMTSGKTDEFSLTIAPGLTMNELREAFKKYGYSDAEITKAFNAKYDHPLLAGRPAGSSLEGYIYPETYNVGANQSLDILIERSFDQFYKVLQEKGLVAAFAARGLSVHQAATMASVIQKEVSDPVDQKQVAQVFFARLAQNMPLQSDPTFIYPARMAGDEPTVNYDSPYNTYKHTGLPPGPIANFNPSALEAVAAPAAGDFLYFVADSQGMTHFSRTVEEHEAKVQQFCTEHCNDFGN